MDRAYVYVYDEAPKSAWPEVKKIDKAIKAAAPHLRILQCLNEPRVSGPDRLADVFDVYVAHYHKAGVAALTEERRGSVAGGLLLSAGPSQLLPGIPAAGSRCLPGSVGSTRRRGSSTGRPTPGASTGSEKADKWPKVPWVANTFGQYNGDGHLIYPGADLKPYSSIRFKALRDGFEDYEYLWTLGSLMKRAEAAGTAGARWTGRESSSRSMRSSRLPGSTRRNSRSTWRIGGRWPRPLWH